LAGCGVVAMTGGWDMIQIERGWSLFIGGAAAVAGGAVVIALGQVVARLDEILAATQTRRAEERVSASSAPVSTTQTKDTDQRPIAPRPAPQTPPPALALAPATTASARLEPAPTARAPEADAATGGEPREVDRFESGDVTYVMYSDGSVEVRTAEGAQRFASLAELRAQAAQEY
jgi:hypothetical protein